MLACPETRADDRTPDRRLPIAPCRSLASRKYGGDVIAHCTHLSRKGIALASALISIATPFLCYL